MLHADTRTNDGYGLSKWRNIAFRSSITVCLVAAALWLPYTVFKQPQPESYPTGLVQLIAASHMFAGLIIGAYLCWLWMHWAPNRS